MRPHNPFASQSSSVSIRPSRLTPVALGLCLCIPLILVFSGCAIRGVNRSISGPDVPDALKIPKNDEKYPGRITEQGVLTEISNFSLGQCLNADWNTKQAARTPVTATPSCTEGNSPDQSGRNKIIYDLKLILDRRYEQYAKNYEQVADTTTFAGEVSAASLSGIATIVGDAGEKAILALASTLTQTTVTSMQKNFYQKQASYAILAVMNSQRLDKWKDILQSMDKGLDVYPLAAALVDMEEYRTRGTAVFALQSIQQSAGMTQVQAAASINATKGINQAQAPLNGPLSVATTSLPTGVVGLEYSATLQAAGGLRPYTWSITPDLPRDLKLDSSTGVISGKPAAPGTSNHTITVTDSSKPNSKTSAASLSIVVQ